MLRWALVVCTTWVTVVEPSAWLWVSVAPSDRSTARTGPACSIGSEPVHGTGRVENVPDCCAETLSRVPWPRRSTCLSGSLVSRVPCRAEGRLLLSASRTSTSRSLPSTRRVIR